MIAKLNGLKLELNLGENILFYDEGSFVDSPNEKTTSIFASYGIDVEDERIEMNMEGCNNYVDYFIDENKRECFHIYYREIKDEILHSMNVANCETNFLGQIKKLNSLEVMLTETFGKPIKICEQDMDFATNAAMYGIYHRDFKNGHFRHKRFMKAMKNMMFEEDFEIFKGIEQKYG